MAKKKEPTRIGRPPVEIDKVVLAKLGALHATHEQIAAWYDCTRRTVINRLKDPEYLLAYENGKQRGKLNLKQLQWRHAQGLDPDGKYINGSQSAAVNMTKHLSQHWLGETDNPPSTTVNTNNTLAVNVEGSGARERITAKLTALSERIESRVVELAAESGASLLPREPIAGGD
jgi:hypothetical protein